MRLPILSANFSVSCLLRLLAALLAAAAAADALRLREALSGGRTTSCMGLRLMSSRAPTGTGWWHNIVACCDSSIAAHALSQCCLDLTPWCLPPLPSTRWLAVLWAVQHDKSTTSM